MAWWGEFRRWVNNLGELFWEIQRRQWHPTPVLLSGKSHGRRSQVGCSPWGREGRTRLSDFPFTFHFHALKEMATHSSVLAWRIPGMAEPGGLPSMGSHRVVHNWSDSAAAAFCVKIIVWLKLFSASFSTYFCLPIHFPVSCYSESTYWFSRSFD